MVKYVARSITLGMTESVDRIFNIYDAGVNCEGLPRNQIHTILENGRAKRSNIRGLLRTGNGVKQGKIACNHLHGLQACHLGNRGKERQSHKAEGYGLHCPKLLARPVFNNSNVLPYKPRWCGVSFSKY